MADLIFRIYIMNSVQSLHARTKAFAQDHPWKSWWCIFSTSFLLAAAVFGTFPLLPLAVRLVCCVLAGLLAVRLFVIYHDQQHRAILPKSWLAETVMRLYGLLVLCPSTVWRSSHDYHHAHNSKLRSAYIGSFPIMTKEEFRRVGAGRRFRYLFARHPLTILFGYVSVFLLGMGLLPLVTAPRKHYDCLLALVLHLALVATMMMMFGWLGLLLTLLIPMFIATSLGAYLFYAQHNFPTVTLKDREGWTYEGAAMESSSYLKMNPVLAWFTGNIGYHHIHHLNHRIPFYRLPETYRAIPELRVAKTTTLHPRDVWRCLRLKVWCVESQRMVGL